MAEKTLLARAGNYAQVAVTENGNDNLILHTGQNVQPILDHVCYMRDLPPTKDMRPVAEIPKVIYQRLLRQGIVEDPAAMKQWLNDPDNRAFRIHPGKV